jgi:hypothetical protein
MWTLWVGPAATYAIFVLTNKREPAALLERSPGDCLSNL